MSGFEMKNKLSTVLICSLAAMISTAEGATHARIVQLSGEVKIRRGLEEKWERAVSNMSLEEIDTILTGENGEVVLEFGQGATFKLGGNSVLDVADLRQITEQELFLILMSQKISKIKPAGSKTPLRIGDVSTIRGEPYQAQREKAVSASQWRRWEVNAAQALAAQNLLTNAALKWHRIKEKFPGQPDCGEVSFYLAQAFEQLRQSGQARDEYQLSLQQAQQQRCEDGETQGRVRIAQERLKQQN
jgi:hypothetical protein